MSVVPRTRSEAARAFAALELLVGRHLDGRLHGRDPGLRLGTGSESEEVARYAPGSDDVRRIDWNVTARASEPHVWRTRADHERETWVLVDDTASMHFGTVTTEKRDLAAQVTGAVGLLSDGPGNRVGSVRLDGSGLHWSAPLPPRLAAVRALSTDRVAAPAGPTEPASGAAPLDLAAALEALERRHRRAGVRVVVSDLVEPDGRSERPFAWERPLRRLAHRHGVLVVEVVDPRDLELPDVGPVVLVDPESGHTQEVLTSSRRVREEYAALAAAHRAAVAAAVRSAGAGHVVVRTDRDWVRDLARFVREQRLPRRGGVR